MTKPDILKELDHHYFWDVEVDKLDVDQSRRLIIERVFSLGTVREIKLLVNFYGEREVIDLLKNLNYMDPKTLNFASRLFEVPAKEFKCYRRTQLNPQHWNS
ncbi:MAG: hypothetical protein WD577_02830 [Bacteroidales bacterium]